LSFLATYPSIRSVDAEKRNKEKNKVESPILRKNKRKGRVINRSVVIAEGIIEFLSISYHPNINND
jgi:hypothetical protein